jgi:uncharacterized OB-fold protein
MAKNKCKKCGRPIVESRKYCDFCKVERSKNKKKAGKGVLGVMAAYAGKKLYDNKDKIIENKDKIINLAKDYFKS